ncbi:WD40/YVTN/BNR-like repeat-containing protein [Undibacterium arcticum]
MSKAIRLASLAMVVAAAAAAVYAFSPRPLPPFAATAIRADRLQINGLVQVGKRLVAVGEAGHILLSDDDGAHWRDAVVQPQTGSTLNQLLFIDAQHGVAVGHDGWIVKTDDGGANWHQVRFDEQRSEPLLGVASAGGTGGASAATLYAVGSFGKFLVSHDAGAHWEPSPLPAVGEAHLNALTAGPKGRLMLTGENGTLLRSSNGGAQWETLALPYKGSLFGALALSADIWLVYGMRGNVFRTEDFGATWERIDTGLQTSFFSEVSSLIVVASRWSVKAARYCCQTIMASTFAFIVSAGWRA